jgi:hypothetical protein
MIREEMPTIGVEDLPFDPRLGEDAITAEDPRRLAAEDAPTRSPSAPRHPATPISLAPIAIELHTPTAPHAVDVWFAETPAPHSLLRREFRTMRTRHWGPGADATSTARAAAFFGTFAAVAMGAFIWGISAVAGSAATVPGEPAVNAAPAPVESYVMPATNLPVLTKMAEIRASRTR